MPYVLALVLSLIFGSSAFAANSISEDAAVPGGTVALARAIGLETSPDASRFFTEIVRLAYGSPERRARENSTLRRLQANLEVVEQFQAAAEAFPSATLTLGRSSDDPRARDALRSFLELVGFSLRGGGGGSYTVEPTNDREGAERLAVLKALGVDLERLETRLNAGESVSLRLPTELVAMPLNSTAWSELTGRTLTQATVFSAVLSRPETAFLGYGLAGLDDESLQYVASSRPLLDRLASAEIAPVFAAFAGNIRIREGRVVTPGGDPAAAMWEAIVGQKTTEPAAFLRSLLTRDEGHVAYLFDLLAELDPARTAFALDLRTTDVRARTNRFKLLVSVVHSSLGEWRVRDTPFGRPLDDIGWLLLNTPVEPDGLLRGLSTRVFWTRAFEAGDLPEPAAAKRAVANLSKDGSIDAAWLASIILDGDRQLVGRRLQQWAFGLRAFAGAPSDHIADVLTAIRALPQYPALMLTLERIGIGDAGVYAAAARRARQLSGLEGNAAFVALNQFQGALALLARMVTTGGLDTARSASLVASLAAVPIVDARYGMGIVEWLADQLLPAVGGRGLDAERAILAALSGTNATAAVPTAHVDWEGEQYRLDLGAAEARRLQTLRQHQRTFSVATALQLAEVARTLGHTGVELPAIQQSVEALRALLPRLEPADDKGRGPRAVPDGVADLPVPAEIVERVAGELTKITRPQDVRRAGNAARPLADLSGFLLGDALSAIAYAVSLGEPSDSTLLSVDLSHRHDFGLGLRDPALRQRTSWEVPRQLVQVGAPRRIIGSLLALDVAFARLTLRRVALDDPASNPTLLSNDRETFTQSVALLNPFVLRDADRDAIASAIARGRARVEALGTAANPSEAFLRAAEEIRMDGWRRRAVNWTLQHDPKRIQMLFSLNELLVLGAGQPATLASWGMSGTPLSGCLCSRLAAPNEWRLVAGRPQMGVMSAVMPDLNLHVAVMLATLKLPAPLAKIVLGAAMQEFVNRVRPNDADDFMTLTLGARLASRERIEDYVAAATADGPLLPERTYVERRP